MKVSLPGQMITKFIFYIAVIFYSSCSDAPLESEAISNDAHIGKSSLRVVTFGILSPGDTLQKIMVENSRNNVMDFYQDKNYMSVSGTLADVNRHYPLNTGLIRITDPYQMPDVFGVDESIDLLIEEAAEYQDPWTVLKLAEIKLAIAAGLVRSITWLSSESVSINEQNTYWMDMKMSDIRYPSIEIIIRDSTTIPAGFNITYPENETVIKNRSTLQLHWTPSQLAEGYRIIATTPHNPRKRFETIVDNTESVFDVPLFFEESGLYEVQIWALDKNYFNFLSQRLEGQRVNRTHFFDYGEMNLSALVVFGSRVMRSVEFTVE